MCLLALASRLVARKARPWSRACTRAVERTHKTRGTRRKHKRKEKIASQ